MIVIPIDESTKSKHIKCDVNDKTSLISFYNKNRKILEGELSYAVKDDYTWEIDRKQSCVVVTLTKEESKVKWEWVIKDTRDKVETELIKMEKRLRETNKCVT
eukprot:UN19197